MSSLADETVAPLIHIPFNEEEESALLLIDDDDAKLAVSKAMIGALRKSGFLRITTPLVPQDLQMRALKEATKFLESPSQKTNGKVVLHPTDPKRYAMLSSREECQKASSTLLTYNDALERCKMMILQYIAVGLDLDPLYFVRLHNENNSCLRLIQYPKMTKSSPVGNRCKEHSDYGTITLLLTDGVSGLEVFHHDKWIPVPHTSGSLVVNAGSLLEKWTNQQIPATLHRVAGPMSAGSTSSNESLLHAVGKDRTSIAFFADPNKDASSILQGEDADGFGISNSDHVEKMTVAEYIRWRSGGGDGDTNRSGLAFTVDEEKRIFNE